MNEQAVLHIPDSRYCFPISNHEIILRLRLARDEQVKKIEVLYETKYQIMTSYKEEELKKRYADHLYDYYEVKLTLLDVRLAYVFRITLENKILFFSEDGLTKTYDFNLGYYNFFQYAYINESDVFPVVNWMTDAVFYQIFVERFCQGEMNKDTSYINLEWNEIPGPKSFAGGDIKGITKHMDYLKELGINALYLTPIFESISNHKYDTIDYKKVDPQFGSNEDFHDLVQQAHSLGIRIVLDAVFNHCSMQNKYFQDVIKYGRKSKYFNWFVIHGDHVDLENVNYECFAACNYMPKFNTSNKEVEEFLIDIALYWIREYDIDGWRLDVSDEISHSFWRTFRIHVKQAKPECVIIGENWHDAYPFLQGDQYDSIMNYAFTKACLDYFKTGAFHAEQMAEKLNSLLMRNMFQVNQMMLNLLDSHDTHRILSEFNQDKGKVLAALAVEFMYLGTPCIYYGTEICLEGGYDPDCRRTFDWNTEHWDQSFLSVFKKILRLKKRIELQQGNIKIESVDELLHISRSYEEKTLSLYVNENDQQHRIPIHGSILVGNKVIDSNQSDTKFSLEPGGFIIIDESKEE